MVMWDCIKYAYFGLKLSLVPHQFHSLAPMYYRGSAAAVIVYDITKQVGTPPLELWCRLWPLSVLGRPKQGLHCLSPAWSLGWGCTVWYNCGCWEWTLNAEFILSICSKWRRRWEPKQVFLPGESHGQRAWWVTVHRVAKSQTRLSN